MTKEKLEKLDEILEYHTGFNSSKRKGEQALEEIAEELEKLFTPQPH